MAQGDIVLNADISWTKVNELSTFDEAVFSKDYKGLPVYHQTVAIDGAKNATAELLNAVYEKADQISEDQAELIQDKISPQVKLRKARNDYSLDVAVFPYRKVGSNIERLVSFDLRIKTTNTAQLKTPTLDYTGQSVLSLGDFYKMQVSQDGIHKISRGLLSDLGMNMDNLNIGNVQVYGLPGGMLPQTAGERRYDDLIEVAVEVVDQNSNGTFDDEDFILFYGEGADSWEFDSNSGVFSFEKNFYTDHHYYFVTRDLGASKKYQLIHQLEPQIIFQIHSMICTRMSVTRIFIWTVVETG